MKRVAAWNVRIRRSTMVLAFAASILAGLLLARFWAPLPFWLVLLSAGAVIASRKHRNVQLAMLVLCGIVLGVWRGAAYLQALQPYYELAGQKVTIQATATQDAVYGKNTQLAFEVSHITFTSPSAAVVPGIMKISGFGELAVYRGDVLSITGKLYPTRGGKQATISYAQIKRIGGHQTFIDELRRRFAAGMQTALPEPAASFGMGLLIGQRNTLPAATSEALLMVGLTHIIAVSGYNLTILMNGSKRMLGKRSKRLTTIVGIALMLFFLLFAGTSASIVRAAVVSGLMLSAWYYGRSVRPMVLILLAAAITAYATPVYFWSDIGWWLSMLAFFGILVIAPKVLALLYKKREAPILSQIAVETLSAELMTIPLILYIFGQVSFVGLLANVLVATLIPIAMLLTFIAGVAGMVLPLLAGWFAWPAKILLTYMLDTATILSEIPNVFKSGVYISAVDMIGCYAAIIVLTLLMHRRRRPWFATLEKQNIQQQSNMS